MIWNVPKMWEGGECWIIGGGPSIPYEFGVPEELIKKVQAGEAPISEYSPYLSPIHDKHVIGINMAFLLGPWIDMIFYGDPGFFGKHRKELLEFPRPKVSCSENTEENAERFGVKYTPKQSGKSRGVSTKPNHVCWNANTGFASFSLARNLGVKKIYLLGFDMTLGKEGDQNWHRRYYPNGQLHTRKRLPFPRHMSSIDVLAQDAERMGIKVINVSQVSIISAFEKQTIKEIFG